MHIRSWKGNSKLHHMACFGWKRVNFLKLIRLFIVLWIKNGNQWVTAGSHFVRSFWHVFQPCTNLCSTTLICLYFFHDRELLIEFWIKQQSHISCMLHSLDYSLWILKACVTVHIIKEWKQGQKLFVSALKCQDTVSSGGTVVHLIIFIDDHIMQLIAIMAEL